MATGTNAIATLQDCNTLGKYEKFTDNLKKAVTYGEIIGHRAPVYPKTVLTDTTKCLKYSDLQSRYIQGVGGWKINTVNNRKNGNVNNVSHNLNLSNYSVTVTVSTYVYKPLFNTENTITGAASGTFSKNSTNFSSLPFTSTAVGQVSFQNSYILDYPNVGAQGSDSGVKFGLSVNVVINNVPTVITSATISWAEHSSTSYTMSKSGTTTYGYTFKISGTTNSSINPIRDLLTKLKNSTYNAIKPMTITLI